MDIRPTENSMRLLMARRSDLTSPGMEFSTGYVNLQDSVECPRVGSIVKYFSGRRKEHRLFKFHSPSRHDLGIEIHKGFVNYVGEVLQGSFLEIRILREDVDRGEFIDEDYEDPEPILVLEKRLPVQELLKSKLSNDRDGEVQLSIRVPFKNDFNHEGNYRYTIKVGWVETTKHNKMYTATSMEKLFEDESSKDLTILARNGAEVKCHKLIFSAAGKTQAFSAMFTASKIVEDFYMRVEMRENSEKGIRTLVQYMYGLELDIDDMASDVALELFQMAHKYEFSRLEGSLQELFFEKEQGWFTSDVVLEIYLFVRDLQVFEKLQKHALFLMASMPEEELFSCEVFKKLDKAEKSVIFRKLEDIWSKHDFRKPDDEQDGDVKRRKIE